MAAQHEEALASAGPTLPANEPHLAKSAAANPRKNAEARRRWEAIVATHGSRASWTIRELAAAVGVGVDTVRQVGREAGLTFQRVLPRSAFRADSPENLANAERVKAALRTHGHRPLRELALVLGTSAKQASRYRLRWLRVVEHAAAAAAGGGVRGGC
jgi:hypothetical protein